MGRVAGADEAGRGPVMGPLVVAAVAVDSEEALSDLDLDDSKRIAPERRERLAPRIRSRADVEVTVVDAETIDRRRSEVSLNRIELDAFVRVLDRIAPDRAIADAADVDEDRFQDALGRALDGTEVLARHRADEDHPVVSAASIVAKVERDRRMEEIGDRLGGEVGSGYPSDPVTVAFLERWVAEEGTLPPHTRRSWRSAERLLARHAQRSLGDFVR